MPPAVKRRLRHLDDAADVGDGLALGDQLLGGFELADDLLRRVPGAFHGEIPGPVWPAEGSHSPWTDFRGPRHSFHGMSWLALMHVSAAQEVRAPATLLRIVLILY